MTETETEDIELEVTGEWVWTSDMMTHYSQTNDPRVLAIVQGDEFGYETGAPIYNDQACLLRESWSYRGYEFTLKEGDDPGRWSNVAEAFKNAVGHFGDEEAVARYLRIFWNAEPVVLSSTVDRYTNAVYFVDTEDTEDVSVHVPSLQAYLDCESYSIGWAINPDRTGELADEPIGGSLDDGWTIFTESYGYWGEEYAKDCAIDFINGMTFESLSEL